MCSYKVVKVFFEVWGLQTRVEAGVHRVSNYKLILQSLPLSTYSMIVLSSLQAVRDIILKGHKQAFLWIDEWHGQSPTSYTQTLLCISIKITSISRIFILLGLTTEDIREYERKVHEETNRMVLSNGTGAVADGATP